MKTKTIGSVPTAQDIVGGEIQSLRNEIAEIRQEQDASTAILATYPQPFSPFTVLFDPSKGRLFAYMPFTGIQDLDSLLIVLVRAGDATSDASIFNNKIEDEWQDIDATEREGNLIQRKFATRLDYNETYYVWRLIGFVQGGGKLKNPENAPVFSDPPIAQFTTPVKFDVPSKPELGLIIENKLDDTTKAFDAFLVVIVYAPANGNPVAYTGNATINGTVTVTGSVTFVGQVVIGQLITINNESRMVTNVVGTTITVDYRFRTAFTGAMQISILFTWAEKQIETVIPKFQLVGDDAPIHPHAKIDGSNENQKFIKIRVPGFVAARQYQWTRNVLSGQGEDSNNTPVATVTFLAGGFTDATAGIPELTAPGYRYETTDPYNGKQRHVIADITQPNPPVPLDRATFRKFVLGTNTISVGGGLNNFTGVGTAFLSELAAGYIIISGGQTFTVQNVINDFNFTSVENATAPIVGQPFYFSTRIQAKIKLRDTEYHPTTGGVISIVWGDMKTKKLLAHIFRTTIFAANGQSKNIDSSFTTANSGEVLTDTAVPVLAVNPATGTTAPLVQERNSKIDVSALMPSANTNTLDDYQFVLSLNPLAPVGDPVEGVAGVQKVKYGQNAGFNLSYFAPLDTIFYIYFRAHNQVGYSAWSAAFIQNGYKRPISDFIGDGVPVHSMGLLGSGTAPGVPPVANDATHYTISTGDSTDYQALIDGGMVIHLHIPSLPASDAVRLVTAYSVATHRFTVSVAFGANPGNSLNYEIHHGNRLGESSGVTHTTTQIKLGLLGAALSANVLLGYSIYMPSQPVADRIRKITAHSGGIVTLETATVGALANNACYLICEGSYGYAAINPLSGIIFAAPFRVWYDNDPTAKDNVLETIMPIGPNAFSTNAIIFSGYKFGTGTLRIYEPRNVAPSSSYRIKAPFGYKPVWRMQLQNMFREGGSDGKSSFTAYVEGYDDSATPPATYEPSTYAPPSRDYQNTNSYPVPDEYVSY
jgi:hypothetical protein